MTTTQPFAIVNATTGETVARHDDLLAARDDAQRRANLYDATHHVATRRAPHPRTGVVLATCTPETTS